MHQSSVFCNEKYIFFTRGPKYECIAHATLHLSDVSDYVGTFDLELNQTNLGKNQGLVAADWYKASRQRPSILHRRSTKGHKLL